MYKVVLEVIVDEEDVEGALAETMMIARNLANHSDVWPTSRKEDWKYEENHLEDILLGQLDSQVKCSVTKVG